MSTAVITGAHGQDAYYLSSLLVSNGLECLATTRTPAQSADYCDCRKEVVHVQLKLNDQDMLNEFMSLHKPDFFFHLATKSWGSHFLDDPIEVIEVNGLATLRILEAIRQHSVHTRFCLASSSEIFAGSGVTPQNETTPHAPLNVYGASKSFAMNLVSSYRNRFGLFACTAVMYNHESPRRRIDYVTRKITAAAAAISMGRQSELILSSLDSRRDWGYAPDYVRAMWLMLQESDPKDYVVATGQTHSVEDFCRVAFSHLGLDYRKFVKVVPRDDLRPEVTELRGDPSRAFHDLGWSPSITFEELVGLMVDADVNKLQDLCNTNP